MKVAEVARRAGVGAHAVRFYVRAGLLQAARDPSNNYKQFGEPHVLRLRFIKGAQSLGFSLAEIRTLLARMDSGECTCDAMHTQLADKILELRRQIEELVNRQAFMQRVYEDWSAGKDGPHDLVKLCRFLERQASQERGAAAAEPNGTEAPKEPIAWGRTQRRAGRQAASGAHIRRPAGLPEAKPRSRRDSALLRRPTGRCVNAEVEGFELLSRVWRPIT